MEPIGIFLAVVHLKLLQFLVQKWKVSTVTVPIIPAPIQLAGLKSRLQRAKGLELRAAAGGTRIDSALDVIENGVTALENHAPQLEQYGNDLMSTINGLLEPGNGGPPLEDPAAAPLPVPGPNGGPRIL